MIGSVGNVSTSNYTYYVSLNNKFSFLERASNDLDRQKWRDQYLWPISKVDSNAACQLAKDWLLSVSMDVKALDRDCDLHIVPNASFRSGTNTLFLPIHWVYWTKGTETRGSVASVQLFLPKKLLMQMRVEEPRDILRESLRFTNRNAKVRGPNESRH